MVWANLTCCSVRLPSLLSASSFARISEELSGVRSSWLMLARNSLLYWLARCSSADLAVRTPCDFGERVLLVLEKLRLLLELRVGLLEFRLLRLQLRLRLPQRPALLLELLVADAQFLLLRLQLFGLPLRLLQQLLEPLPILRGAHRHARSIRIRASSSSRLRRIDGAEESEFDHGMDDAVDAGRRDEQLAAACPARRRRRSADSPPGTSRTWSARFSFAACPIRPRRP